MSAWSDLPNAADIDAVIESIISCPQLWNENQQFWKDLCLNNHEYQRCREFSYRRLKPLGREAIYGAVVEHAWCEVHARDGIDRCWGLFWPIALALIAYDHSQQYLTMPVDELEVWSRLSADPPAVLLIPYLRGCEQIITPKIYEHLEQSAQLG